jgi:hypothetical protein
MTISNNYIMLREYFVMLKKYYFAGMIIVLAVAITCQAEFRVNTNTSDVQEYPDIAMDPDGNFVVAWRSEHTGSRTTCGQRFSADGTPVGGEFQISTGSVGGRIISGPSVAMDNFGNFVVAWTGYTGDEEYIYARRYSSNGSPLTGEFAVSTTAHADIENSHIAPSVAMNASGAFVIVWEAWHGDDGHNGTWGVYARAYDASGNPRGDEFIVTQLFHGHDARVAIDDSGDFVVAWLRSGDSNHPPYGSSIRFRRYNANGTPKDSAVQIVEGDTLYIGSIGMDGDGNFNVAWSSHPETYTKVNVYVQQFTSTGIAVRDPFMVNTYTIGMQSKASIAMNRYGQFVTVWHSSENQDGSEYGVYGKEYNNDAMPMGGEFQVNTYTLGRQRFPNIALGENGKYVTVWESMGQDGSDYGIYGEFGYFPEPSIPCDFDNDYDVDANDFYELAMQWLDTTCTQDGLVAQWKLDEDANRIASDSVSGGHDGTLTNFYTNDSQWVAGKFSGALRFDGIDDYVEIAGYKGIFGSAARTVSAWIKTGTAGEIVTWGTTSTGEKYIFRVQDTNGTAGAIRVEVNGGYIVGDIDLRDNEWHHVAAVLEDGDTDILDVKLYVDGVLEAVSASVGPQQINTVSGDDVKIGVFAASSRYFYGQMDDVRIYDRGLSAGEILTMANPDSADFNCDCTVNLPDFAVCAKHWLEGTE